MRNYVEWLPLESYVCINGQMHNSFHNINHVLPMKTKRKVNGMMKKIVAAEQKWKCCMCQKMLSACFEVDHIIRLADGGSNDKSNLMALCRECHGMKTAYEQCL